MGSFHDWKTDTMTATVRATNRFGGKLCLHQSVYHKYLCWQCLPQYQISSTIHLPTTRSRLEWTAIERDRLNPFADRLVLPKRLFIERIPTPRFRAGGMHDQVIREKPMEANCPKYFVRAIRSKPGSHWEV
jgi:hypothetical protein